MLNPFPDLLILGFFAPFLLRVAIGLFFVWMAYQHIFKKQSEICEALHTRPFIIPALSSVVRPLAPYFVWIFSIGEAVIGVMFIVGFFTQIAALLSIIVLVKMIVFRKYLREIAFYSPATYLVLIAISFSLLLSGAGALAFDLPL